MLDKNLEKIANSRNNNVKASQDQEWHQELDILLAAIPPHIIERYEKFKVGRGFLLEIILDLGRPPLARFEKEEVELTSNLVNESDIEHVVKKLGNFQDDNRAGIASTLHRISAIRNRAGKIVGLTCRVGRSVSGTADLIKDLVIKGNSILLLGPPGVGKTTMLRECARLLSVEEKKRVVIVDTSNEIGGDGDVPHVGVGKARRMQVPSTSKQHETMIEAVENHMPEVIVIDEIGNSQEAEAARTIAERGVQLIATAHGKSLQNLLINPSLNDLLGGVQAVTLGDVEAERRGTQKTVLEREAPPTFDVLVEIQERNRVLVHTPLDKVVDAALLGASRPGQLRIAQEDGQVLVQNESLNLSENSDEDDNEIFSTPADWGTKPNSAKHFGRVLRQHELSNRKGNTVKFPQISIFPYGVSTSNLEKAARDVGVGIRIQNNIDDVDLVLTLKNYSRRKNSPVKDAEAIGIPVHVLRGNSLSQLKGVLNGVVRGDIKRFKPRIDDEKTDALWQGLVS